MSGEGCRRVRFFCEWCHDRVRVLNRRAPYGEVLAHFVTCVRRSPMTTDEQVAGLAAHISKLIADQEENRMRQVG
jgi:hypothetical protein